MPLVVMLHGGFGTGEHAANAYHWLRTADRAGFVAVFPDGVRRSWNAGGFCCGPALRNGVDDVGFITRLIETVAAVENVDPARVYLAGMSNGAAMVYRYACEGSYPVAAIGSVAGTFTFDCAKPHAVSLLAIHGLADGHVPYAGGQGMRGVTKGEWLPVETSIGGIRAADHCKPAAIAQHGLVTTASAACEAGRAVELITIEGAGHQWPGAEPPAALLARVLDQPSREIDATDVLWQFFASHPRPRQR